MRKPHKITITWDNKENPKTRRSFATKAEADAFCEGANVANIMDGINGFVYKYTFDDSIKNSRYKRSGKR